MFGGNGGRHDDAQCIRDVVALCSSRFALVHKAPPLCVDRLAKARVARVALASLR